jgi:hypothetical protein
LPFVPFPPGGSFFEFLSQIHLLSDVVRFYRVWRQGEHYSGGSVHGIDNLSTPFLSAPNTFTVNPNFGASLGEYMNYLIHEVVVLTGIANKYMSHRRLPPIDTV